MDKIIISPSKYVQGPNVIGNLGVYVKPLDNTAIVLADDFVTQMVKRPVTESFAKQDINGIFSFFCGECCHQEIDRLTDIAREQKVETVVGIGGGKVLDTAKAVAAEMHCPVVIVPTIASTDAPTSALSMIYTPEGEFSEYRLYTKNPDVVIMDTQIVAEAPTRLLVSGMGDALSTYFEARANERSGKGTMAGGAPTKAAQALAKLCYQILMEDGFKAKVACDNNLSSRALENVVEANTYLSGIGFESSGLAAAHAIHNGLTLLEECHHLYHGEKVAFWGWFRNQPFFFLLILLAFFIADFFEAFFLATSRDWAAFSAFFASLSFLPALFSPFSATFKVSMACLTAAFAADVVSEACFASSKRR